MFRFRRTDPTAKYGLFRRDLVGAEPSQLVRICHGAAWCGVDLAWRCVVRALRLRQNQTISGQENRRSFSYCVVKF